MTTSLVVVESHWGNTERIAYAVAEGLAAAGDARVVRVDDAPTRLEGVDLLVIGAPTHAFSLSRPATRDEAIAKGATQPSASGIREWMARIEADARHILVATFDTKVEQVKRLPGSAAWAARRVAKSAGLPLTQRPTSFSIVGYDGPVLPGELERARQFGRDRVGAAAVSFR